MKRWPQLLCAAVLAACLAPAAGADSRALLAKIDTDDFGLPAPASLGRPLTLWATWYHVFSTDAVADGYPLLSVQGEAISPPIAPRDWCMGALQGVLIVKLADGVKRTYTYETTGKRAELNCAHHFKHKASWMHAAGDSRFAIATGPYGDGAGSFQVVPFRTVAVDTGLIPLGTVLYIPAARGVEVTLPSGRKVRHDGYFFASDRGGGIHRNHIDVFGGVWPANPFPSFIGSSSKKTFDAYVVGDERVKPHLHRLHARD